MIHYVYKATHKINRKAYVGKSGDLITRIATHLRARKTKSRCHFHSAMRKYGIDQWEWEVLDFARDEDQAYALEHWWIAYYDTFYNGYNMTEGGIGGKRGPQSEEHIIKRANANRGAKRTEEQKARMRKPKSNNTNSLKGIPKSLEAKRAMRAARAGRTWDEIYGVEVADKLRKQRRLKNSIRVEVDGTIYESIKAAAKANGITSEGMRHRIKIGKAKVV